MQLGRLETIDQAAVDHVSKLSKVENLDKKSTVQADDKYKNISNQVNKINENEVLLDNVQFGFDQETKEFFVRIKNGAGEIQFPTEEIMKMKAYFSKLLQEQS